MPDNRLYLLLLLPLLLRLTKSKRLPKRETTIPSKTERVLLLGASSGVGRELALEYAKRGARVCLFARRADTLQSVKQECVDLGAQDESILVVDGDITNTEHLLKVRDTIRDSWGGVDTVHILAGVTCIKPLHQLAGSTLVPAPASVQSTPGVAVKRVFKPSKGDQEVSGLPTKEALDYIAKEARYLSEINYVGTTLSLAVFVPMLASTSKAPVLHHLSSVGAKIPAPTRLMYSATKGAALMAVETCRVECEGTGVRFFSTLPGTIDNDFRKKSGAGDEKNEGLQEKLLLKQQDVIDIIMSNISVNPDPRPIIPYFPFNLIRGLSIPPPAFVFLPKAYGLAWVLKDTPLGWLFIEPSARAKYGLAK